MLLSQGNAKAEMSLRLFRFEIFVIAGVLAVPLLSLAGNKESTAAAPQVLASQGQKKVVLKNLGMV
jgi:hypothetical protein